MRPWHGPSFTPVTILNHLLTTTGSTAVCGSSTRRDEVPAVHENTSKHAVP